MEAFYWVRRAFTHGILLDGCRVTIGYPIYIAEIRPDDLGDSDPYHNQPGVLVYTEREIEQYASFAREKALEAGDNFEVAEAKAQKERRSFEDLSKSLSKNERMIRRTP